MAIRACLEKMAPEHALDYLNSFHLPEIEERFIVQREIEKKTIIQIANENHTTREVVNRTRSSAFRKIADAIDYRNEKSWG